MELLAVYHLGNLFCAHSAVDFVFLLLAWQNTSKLDCALARSSVLACEAVEYGFFYFHVGMVGCSCSTVVLRLRSSQKATAAAAATLSESTLCDMGMRTTCVALAMVSAGRPSPSVPMMIASLGRVVSSGESMGVESSVSAMAAVAKPSECSCSMPPSSQLQGTRKTLPMETRTARRLSGSHELRVSSTASMPSAAAERNMAPMLVVSTTPSMTTMRLALWHISSTGGSMGRCIAHSTPRVRV